MVTSAVSQICYDRTGDVTIQPLKLLQLVRHVDLSGMQRKRLKLTPHGRYPFFRCLELTRRQGYYFINAGMY